MGRIQRRVRSSSPRGGARSTASCQFFDKTKQGPDEKWPRPAADFETRCVRRDSAARTAHEPHRPTEGRDAHGCAPPNDRTEGTA